MTTTSTKSSQSPLLNPRIAVVGSGLAGLTAAYLLHREGADVFLIEKAPRLGFHAWSVELDAADRPRQQEGSSKLPIDASTPALQTPSPSRSPSPLPCLEPSTPLPSLTPSAPTTGVSGVSAEPNELDQQGSKTVAVDVPMRSFQGGYYPLLLALYKHLGLPMEPMHFTFSFSSLAGRRLSPYFMYGGASGISVPDFASGVRSSPVALVRGLLSFVVVAICYVALVGTAFLSWHNLLPARLDGASVRDVTDAVASALDRPVPWLPRTRLGPSFRAFASDIVLPLFSAVGTMTAEDVWSTPAIHILDYIHAGVGTHHYTLGGGTSARDVASRLAAPLRARGADRVRLGTSIRAINYAQDGRVELVFDGGDTLLVDRVVLATQASTARSLLATLEPSLAAAGEEAQAHRVSRMRSALGDVAYRDTIVVTHRDTAVLPDPADTRAINLVQPTPSSLENDNEKDTRTPPLSPCATPSPPATPSPCPTPTYAAPPPPFFHPVPGSVYTMATHIVPTPAGPVLQTTNPVIPIDPSSVLGTARLERALPVRDARTLAGLNPACDEPPLVLLAGSYVYPGIPLLEGCVGSARRVVDDVFGLQASAGAGGVDWDAGKGGLVGRLWRWRRKGRGGY